MNSRKMIGKDGSPAQPLGYSLELLANLIYLAGRTEAHSDEQRRYLDWAARVIEEMHHHPRLHE